GSQDVSCGPLLLLRWLCSGRGFPGGSLASGGFLCRSPGLCRRARLCWRLRLRLGLGLFLLCGTRTRMRADRLDLDLRELGAEARMPAVALLGLVLPDPDLRAERRADHLRRHLDARREVRLAVAAREEDVRMKRLALVGR